MSRPSNAAVCARLIHIAVYLMNNEAPTVAEVCDALGMRRDEFVKAVELLDQCDVTMLTGGHRLRVEIDDDTVIAENIELIADQADISRFAALCLLTAARIVAEIEPDGVLNDAIGKLERAIPNVDVVDVNLAESGLSAELLATLRAAVAERRLVTLTYKRGYSGEITERDVEPIAVRTFKDHWYLRAYCRLRGDVRTFRVSRILAAAMHDETFVARSRADDGGIEYVAGDDDVRVRLTIEPSAKWAVSFYPNEGWTQDGEDGPITVEFASPSLDFPVYLALRLGPAVVAVDPALKLALQDAIADVRRRHGLLA